MTTIHLTLKVEERNFRRAKRLVPRWAAVLALCLDLIGGDYGIAGAATGKGAHATKKTTRRPKQAGPRTAFRRTCKPRD